MNFRINFFLLSTLSYSLYGVHGERTMHIILPPTPALEASVYTTAQSSPTPAEAPSIHSLMAPLLSIQPGTIASRPASRQSQRKSIFTRLKLLLCCMSKP